MANPNPPTAHLTPWKPGQSGNPSGVRKKKLGLFEYMTDFFDEEVDAIIVDSLGADGKPKTERMPRAKLFARMIGNAAMHSDNPMIQRECMRIVINTLYPEGSQPTQLAIINADVHHPRAVGFFDRVVSRSIDGSISPASLLAELEAIDPIAEDEEPDELA